MGGPAQGHQYLFEANIDWGQDLYFVKDWIKRHPEARPVTLSWYEIFDPGVAGLNLPPTPVPTSSHLSEASGGPVEGQSATQGASVFEGWHLVSVHNLQSADQRFTYLRELEPVDRIGYSVMVYHLDAAQAERARTRIGTPLVPPKVR